MKFMLHINPVVPASPEERERLRPIAHRTEKIQELLQEMTELTQMAEELGFEIVTFSEHHFYTEGRKAELRGDHKYKDEQYAKAAEINREALRKFKERNGIPDGEKTEGKIQPNTGSGGPARL